MTEIHNDDATSIIIQQHKDLTDAEKEAYIKLCKRNIINHVQRSTGFSDIDFNKVDIYTETFISEVYYIIAISPETVNVTGCLPSSPDHTIVADSQEFGKSLIALGAADLQNETLRSQLEESLLKHSYGAITEQVKIYENPHAFLLHNICQSCAGHGSLRCELCGGRGEYQCDKCKGSGQVKCPWCR